MKICVLGSNSFSGSNFIDYVLEKKNVSVIGISRSKEKHAVFLPYKRRAHPPFRFHQMDMNTDMPDMLRVLDAFAPQYIVNFAAQSEVAPSWEHPEHWYRTNVVALACLTNHLRKQSYLKRYLHVSSPEVYGTCDGLVKEDAPLNPSTPYAASKAAADLHLETLWKNFRFPLLTVRSTNVYGAHQQLHKIIPRTVIAIKKRKKVLLHGGGRAVKSYIHIRDISKGEYLVVTKGRIGQRYHLSPEKGISVREVVRMICKRMGTDFATVTRPVGERLGQDAVYTIDSAKARRELGWKPEISLDQGVQEVIEWIQQNWHIVRGMPVDYIHAP